MLLVGIDDRTTILPLVRHDTTRIGIVVFCFPLKDSGKLPITTRHETTHAGAMSLTTGIAHDGKLVIAPLYATETLRSLYHQLLLPTERSLQLVYGIQIIQFLAPRVTSIQSLHPDDRSRLIVSPSEITRIWRGGVIAHGSDNHWILSQCLHVFTINIHDFYRGREITVSYRIRIRFLHLSEQHHGAIGRKTCLAIDTRRTDFRFPLRSYLH